MRVGGEPVLGLLVRMSQVEKFALSAMFGDDADRTGGRVLENGKAKAARVQTQSR